MLQEGKKAFEELVQNLKKHAAEKYEAGGDRMIECWDMDDFLKFIVECAMYARDPFTCADELFSLWDEQRKGVEMWADKGPWE